MRGFRKPRGDRPLFKRASLTSEMMPAKVGELAEVPPMRAFCPPITTAKNWVQVQFTTNSMQLNTYVALSRHVRNRAPIRVEQPLERAIGESGEVCGYDLVLIGRASELQQ